MLIIFKLKHKYKTKYKNKKTNQNKKQKPKKMTIQNAQQKFQQLQQELGKSSPNLDGCGKILSELKIFLLDLSFLPATGQQASKEEDWENAR